MKTLRNPNLPDYCYIVDKVTENLVGVKNGISGYLKTIYNLPGDKTFNKETADYMNKLLGITKKQAAIMETASKTTWAINNKLLNPEIYNKMGKIIIKKPTITKVNKNVRRLTT